MKLGTVLEQNLGGGGNVPRVPIKDQVDKFILKRVKNRKKQGMRATENFFLGDQSILASYNTLIGW